MSEKEVLQTLLEAANGKITDLTAEVTNLASKLADAQEQRVSLDDLAKLLPGTYYMDPPDGGDVHVMEQLRRMAEDADKFRAGSAQSRPWAKLWGTQWMNIVNHERAYDGWSTEDAVHHAVKMTEEQCRLNNSAPASAAPVVQVAGGDQHPAWSRMVLYTDTIGGNQTCRDDLWAITSGELRELLAAKVSARAADAPSEPSELQWRDQFWKLALALDCFPSQFIDANEHVFKAVELLKSRAADALDSQPTDSSMPVDISQAKRWIVQLRGRVDTLLAIINEKAPASSQPTDGEVRNG